MNVEILTRDLEARGLEDSFVQIANVIIRRLKVAKAAVARGEGPVEDVEELEKAYGQLIEMAELLADVWITPLNEVLEAG